MENFQKLEQIVEKTGCSYEDAKATLEECGWDMIDAVISLEKYGKVKKESAAAKTAAPAEATQESVSEAGFGSDSRQSVYSNESAGQDGSAEKTGNTKSVRKGVRYLWNRVKRIVMNNRMLVLKGSGDTIIDLPILVPIISFILFFWATLGLSLLAMLLGCRFHFEGEDLGRTNINNTMDKATEYAEKVKSDLSGKTDEK